MQPVNFEFSSGHHMCVLGSLGRQSHREWWINIRQTPPMPRGALRPFEGKEFMTERREGQKWPKPRGRFQTG